MVTNDSHYPRGRDWQFHDIIIKTRFGYATDFELDVRNYYLKSEEEMRDLGFPSGYYDMATEIALRCRVGREVFSPDPGEGGFDPEGTVVFSSKQVIIDVHQALKDVTGAWRIQGRGIQAIIDSLPRGMDIGQALRESPPLAGWLEENPRVREAAERLVGIPRRSQPDFSTVIDLPFEKIREVIPVRRARGEIMAAYPPAVLKELGVPLRSVDSLSETAPAFSAWVKQLTLMDEAREKYDDRDYTSSSLLLEGIIKANPDDLEARFLLGEAFYFQIGRASCRGRGWISVGAVP